MQSIDERMKKGMFLGGIEPYGYKKDPEDGHHLIIDEEPAKVVRDIYMWYTKDELYMSEITLKLNDLGIPGPYAMKRLMGGGLPEKKDRYANLWSKTTVRNILKNQVYLGHMVQSRFPKKNTQNVERRILPEDEWIIVKNTHAPIIEEDTFYLAKKRLEENRRYNSEGTYDNEFAGLLRCPDCGLAMARLGHRHSKSRGFQCSTYRDRSKTACTRHAIQVKDLREAVLDAIKMQIKMALSLYDMIDEVCGTPKILDEIKLLNSEIHDRESKYEDAINHKATTYMDWKSGKLEKTAHDQTRAALDEQLKELGDTIDALRRERETIGRGIDFVQSHLGMFLKHQAITGLDRTMLLELVDVIYVHEGGKVEVNFLFKEEFRLVMEFIGRFI